MTGRAVILGSVLGGRLTGLISVAEVFAGDEPADGWVEIT